MSESDQLEQPEQAEKSEKTTKKSRAVTHDEPEVTDKLLDEVAMGRWGYGPRRVVRLTDAGYNPVDVARKMRARRHPST